MKSQLTVALVIISLVFTLSNFEDVYADKPIAPILTVDGFTDTTIDISWIEGGVSSPLIDTFEIKIKDITNAINWDTVAIVPVTTLDYQFTGLFPENEYDIKVEAVSAGGKKKSNEETVTTLATPPPSIEIKSGGGCSGDCTPPTLGIDRNGLLRVDDGLIYNNQTVDVTRFNTNFQQMDIEQKDINTIKLKIYEDSILTRIKHITIAFGLDKFSVSGAEHFISIDQDFRGNFTIVSSPSILVNKDINAQAVSCGAIKALCLELSVDHIFIEPLSGYIGVYVWDTRLNSWQFFFNDGLTVLPEPVEEIEPVEVEEEYVAQVSKWNAQAFRGTDAQERQKVYEAERANDTFTHMYGNIYNWTD